MSELCIVCGEEVHGGFEVSEHDYPDGTFELVIKPTEDCDFNVCDLCNVSVHLRCSRLPSSGYCDGCVDKLEASR